MSKHLTILRCSQTTATILFILVGSLFLIAGCAQFYRSLGMSADQVLEQVAADQQAKEQIFQGIRYTTTEIITTAIAGLGAIASGFLAKWLGTERKITKVLITGIEAADSGSIVAGTIETSNVNAAGALVNMIELARQFEMQVKMLKTAEENNAQATQMLKLG